MSIPVRTVQFLFFSFRPISIHQVRASRGHHYLCSLFSRLITSKSIVKVLTLRRLVPLAIRALLAPTKTTSTLRATISHGRADIAGRRPALRTSKVTRLTTILGCTWEGLVSQRSKRRWTEMDRTLILTVILRVICRGCRKAWRLRALGAVGLDRIEVSLCIGSLVFAPLRHHR